MSNGSLISAHGNAIWRAWIGISQDIDLNSRHVGSNLFRTNRRWWVSICSITPGKFRATKLLRQLQICSRSPLRAVLCHTCGVSGHPTAIIIASLQRLCRIISGSALGGAIGCDPGSPACHKFSLHLPRTIQTEKPQALSHLLRIRAEYKAVAHSIRSARPYHGH